MDHFNLNEVNTENVGQTQLSMLEAMLLHGHSTTKILFVQS